MLTILAESALRSLLLGSAVWVGLNLLRIRNPQVHMTAWVLVLVASLAMPLLMHWTTVTITTPAPSLVQSPAPEQQWPSEIPVMEPLPAAITAATTLPTAAPSAASFPSQPRAAINWLAIATVIYAGVAGLLLLRLLIGLGLTWRLARAARPIDDPMIDAIATARAQVRVSEMIGGPVTFGTTILLPPHHVDWDGTTRQAVLAHEGAHVANRDFYVLLLASLNRAVFWFSPFAWWQLTRLAELAEIISDDQAMETFEDKLSYAEILLDMVQTARRTPAALQMARASTIRLRVERILAAPPSPSPAPAGWRKRIWTAAIVLPVAIASAGTIAFRSESVFVPVIEGAGEAAAVSRTPQQAAFYGMGRLIFAVFRDGDDVFGQLSGQRKLRLTADGDGSYAYPAPGGRIVFATPFISGDDQPSELMLRQNGVETLAKRIAGFAAKGLVESQPLETAQLESYVGAYEVTPGRALTVTREGERLMLQDTGRPKVVVSARGADTFSGRRDDLVIFLRDAETKVTRVLLQEPVSDVRIASRIPAAKAKAIEEDFARRVADVPERFRDQSPQVGSKEAVLRGIEDLQHGTPNYERMSTQLGNKIRSQAAQLQPMFAAFGPVESIFFRGVGPGGYDIYGVKFANGSAEFRLLLTTDGKADDVLFRPDGDEELGRFAACSNEATLRPRSGTAPISLLIYNSSGREIQLYALDAQGKRISHGTIGDTMTSMLWTTVDSPWVITDTAGQCLEIVMTGQRTRYHTVEASTGTPSERQVARRSAPLAGSEATLRHYIEALSRGEPDYDRMTSEVATQTRQQLPLNQAILTRLGALRAMSFRGVTGLGSDIYMAHFANGTAEWRISVARDGTVERIALGPQ